MRIGLSTSAIEPVYTNGRLDGIGVYTNQLKRGFELSNQIVQGVSFPKLGFSQSVMSKGKVFPVPYSVAATASLISGGLIKYNLDVDVFHTTDYRVLPMACPVVATLYDAIPLKHPEMSNSRFRKIKNYTRKSVAKFADHVIAISAFSVKELVEFYEVPETKISVVHCGVEKAWLEAVSTEELNNTLQIYGLEQGYFLFVGTIQPRKNIQRVLDAYLKLPKAIQKERRLVVVGKAGWECDDIIFRLKALEKTNNILWLNNVASQDELRCLFSGAGVFVFPSLYEGFGLPVLEAFACGVPVVTSNTTSLPEVSNGIALEVNPESVDEISSAMLCLIQDEVERAERIKLGKVRAESMTWNKTVERTLNVYRKLI